MWGRPKLAPVESRAGRPWVLDARADFSRRMGVPSILVEDGTTPAGQVARLLAFGQFQGFLEGVLEVGLNGLALDFADAKNPPTRIR